VVGADGSLVVADTYNEILRVMLVPFKLSLQTSGVAHTLTISWDTVVGKKYQVQFKENLAATWTNLGSPLQAAGLNLNASDNFFSASSQRLYRVLLLP
jgi:hypothetical protein